MEILGTSESAPQENLWAKAMENPKEVPISVEVTMGVSDNPNSWEKENGILHSSAISFKSALIQAPGLSKEDIEKRIAEFGDSDDDEEMEFDEMYQTKSKIKITFSNECLKRSRAYWKGCLIIKLLGKIIGFKSLMDRVHHLRNLEGTMVPVDVGIGYYIIRFETKSDYHRVNTGGPWIIQDHYLTVKKWHSNFIADMATAIKTAVWVRVPLLPTEFFEEDNIKEIDEKLGKYLKLDTKTYDSKRGSYARICVEMDLIQPLPPSIAVERYDYFLEYEHLHQICFSCGRVGHRWESCGMSPKSEKGSGEVGSTVGNTGNPDNKAVKFNGQLVQENQTEIGFGEWMVVSRKKTMNRNPGWSTEATHMLRETVLD
ncbi:hypothetical protein RHMOL_Rhmol08G0188600 [Rhododendron molle]|uniref:Uncharacterized protein n=1 Tax=Rhododendron molle TaxID=49168 RepID=A0ACC0MQ06_RHOML|nr:hypothetical protein RHMOL_Rhmol08G0188600 [Rhododendron molle]